MWASPAQTHPPEAGTRSSPAPKSSPVGLTIADQIGNLKLQGSASRNLGLACYFLGDYKKAESFFRKAYKLHEQIGDEWSMAGDIGNLGLIDLVRDEYDLAIERFQECLELLEKVGAREDQVSTLHDLGNAYRLKGDIDRSVAFLEKAIRTYDGLGKTKRLAETYSLLGLLCYEHDRLSRAKNYLDKGLQAIVDLQAPVQRRDILSNLGLVYISLNRFDEAATLIEEAFRLLDETESKVVRGILLNNLGLAQRAQGEYEKARENLLGSYEIRQRLGTDSETETTLYNLGVACLFAGRLDEALRYLSESQKICKTRKWLIRLGWTLSALGLVYEDLGQIQRSRDCYEEAIDILESSDDFEGQWSAYYNLGRLLESEIENLDEAQVAYGKSIACLMKLRKRMSIEHRATYAEDKMRVFEHMVIICADKRDVQNALRYAELSKSRAFVELLLDTGNYELLGEIESPPISSDIEKDISKFLVAHLTKSHK